MNLDEEDIIKKALVAYVIEKTLLGFGVPILEKVIKQLYDEYHCYLPDCYKHPEYLKKVLKDLFGRSHIVIVRSIKKELDDFADQKPIKMFLDAIGKK